MRPRTWWLPLLLPCACALPVAGCGPSTPTPAVPDDGQDVAAGPSGPTLMPADGAVAIEQPCTEGAEERCDGVDQNCDGRIDEGCGYEPGALQVTLAWNSDADLDLSIVSPDGSVLEAGSPEASSGGILDRAARGGCGEGPGGGHLESAHWPTDPPSGEYALRVSYADGCADEPPPTTATLAVSYGGRVRGVYNLSLTGPGTVDAATLTLP